MPAGDRAVARHSDGTRDVTVPVSVLEQLTAFAQGRKRKEAGGILLGRIYRDHDDIVCLAEPSAGDRAGLFSFLRRRAPAQKKIDDAWNRSGGHIAYLGEWHTHPGSIPLPSGQDRRMIERATQSTIMDIDYLYLLIGGRDGAYWIGRRTPTALIECSLTR
jgi:integrative and conjugative element protein (TIGR02256 family)